MSTVKGFATKSRLVGLALVAAASSLLMQVSHAGIVGEVDDNAPAVENSEIIQDVIYPGRSFESRNRGPGSASDSNVADVTVSDGTKIPDFITRLVRKPDHGEFNCHGNTCMASRNTCVAAPDYEMINDVPYASPRSSGPRAEGSEIGRASCRERV